jgi:hypothetical protein
MNKYNEYKRDNKQEQITGATAKSANINKTKICKELSNFSGKRVGTVSTVLRLKIGYKKKNAPQHCLPQTLQGESA